MHLLERTIIFVAVHLINALQRTSITGQINLVQIVIKMKTIEESIATAMDFNNDVSIIPYLPYILQDFWELGTPSEAVIDFIKKHCNNYSMLKVLDLGCGKGAVSVKLAAALKCNCFGIDGIPDFITTSREKAQEYGVEELCKFEVGDIRETIETAGKFDVIILGAIGQVFGNYYDTLTILSKHLTQEGIIIINDAYINDTSSFQHPAVLHRSELLKQIEQADMKLIDEDVDASIESAIEFENLQRRCMELIAKYPDKTSLFESYIKAQADEYEALESEMIGSIMVISNIS